jgi:hypothetical protein
MHTSRSLFSIARRAAFFSCVMTGTALLMHAQQPAATDTGLKTPLLLASSASLANSSYSSSSDDSSSSDTLAKSDHLSFNLLDSSQPPPRRRYGRPNYSDSHTNPDGSSKFAFMAGAGATVPVGDTHRYYTPSYNFQVGVGRNWSQAFGVMAQFDYNRLGLQGSTLANQYNLYSFYGCGTACAGLDGNGHVWSFTLNPTFSLKTEGTMGAYAVVGAGYYHKVTNFTVPTVGTYCDYYFGCYQYQANQIIDHYTSNAFGINGGIGATWKFAKFANERLYAELRYVVVFDPQRYGVTAFSSTSTLNRYNGSNFFPQNSNRTTYLPINVGIRF